METDNGKMKKTLDRLFLRISEGYPDTPFGVDFWDGATNKYGEGEKKFTLKIKEPRAVTRIMTQGSLGFGEEYMRGAIDVDGDLQALIKLGNSKAYRSLRIPIVGKIKIIYAFMAARDTVRNARKNIQQHYDIGNDFYKLWLDPSLTYSCAYFKRPSDTLEQAQQNKYAYLCRKLRLKIGERLVDIGCGWGGIMFYAAKKYGVECVGYTLSENQYEYVVERITKEKMQGQVKIHLKDYREAEGQFDKFVSIGMFEHVGKAFYPAFFATVKRLLKPEGLGVLHHIGTTADRPTDPWVTKYIFPGGWLPTLSVVCAQMNKHDLVFYDIEDLRPHYARTLDSWIKNFESRIGDIKKALRGAINDEQGVTEFIRMWRLYLNGSSVSFKYGSNRLYQITFSNGPNNSLPLTRKYIYE